MFYKGRKFWLKNAFRENNNPDVGKIPEIIDDNSRKHAGVSWEFTPVKIKGNLMDDVCGNYHPVFLPMSG